ncbi:MAG TPA: hypothetical protein VGM88_31830 [Kofleriaceae bacterium]
MRPVPAGPWGRIWITALVLIVAAVSSLEIVARRAGYQPSVKDDEYAWTWERMRVSDDSPRTVALVGTSRLLLAFSVPTLRELRPTYKPVQLAIDGVQPGGVLIDLANDPDFRGVVIVDTIESGITPENWHSADPYVRAYHHRERAIGSMADRWLTTLVQSHVALLSINGAQLSIQPYVTTFPDRTQYADYSRTDAAAFRERQLVRVRRLMEGPAPTPADADRWLQSALEMEPYVDRIQARGGRVVYVRMPVCDERWIADQHKTPKDQFWDRLAARTHALAIHFADYPTLRDFTCPDTSHLDSKDAPRFTRALLEILIERGVLPEKL